MKKLTNNNRFLSLIIGLVLAVFLTSCSKDVVGGEETGRKPLPEEPTKDVNSFFDKIKDENNLEGKYKVLPRYYLDDDENVLPEPPEYFQRKVTFDTNVEEEYDYAMLFHSRKRHELDPGRTKFHVVIFKNIEKVTYPAMWYVDRREWYGLSVNIKMPNNRYTYKECLVDYKEKEGRYGTYYYKSFEKKINHLYLYKTTVGTPSVKDSQKHELYVLFLNPTKEDIKKLEDYKEMVYKKGKFFNEYGSFENIQEYDKLYRNYISYYERGEEPFEYPKINRKVHKN
jgi:lipoprotein